MHAGHRERLISKLIGGNTLLSDHEILEILLFYTIPRKNVNDLAHRLISSFGSLQGCFSADYHSLISIEGVGHKTATFIITMGEIQARIAKNTNELPVIFSFDSCKQMLINSFRGSTEEKFCALFLDKQGKIVFRKIFSSHENNEVTIDIGELLKGTLVKKPHGVVICHNHLSNNCNPSDTDDRSTEKIYLALKLNGISLIDHIIVAGDKAFSYHVYDKLEAIKKKVDQTLY